MAKVLLLNGPNLNLLGQREPGHYGAVTLADIEKQITQQAQANSLDIACTQSNSEAALIERIHAAAEEGVNFILFNPAAFTHTSIALRDALLATAIPFIEIHLSNVYARENFRQHSYFSGIALGTITGLGAQGYELALAAAIQYLSAAK